jgi:O-acetyl-ADP-ribose deacetylase (regulator of RNase III)
MAQIILLEGDITEQHVDAIVNAANTELQLGSGVAGAIRAKGGPEVQAECDACGTLGLGEAALTGAGQLPARFVIHAASMELGGAATEDAIRRAVAASMALAQEQGFQTIAFPALGAGVGGFSLQACAEISLEEVRLCLAEASSLEEVRFVLWGEPAFRVFEMVNDRAKVAAQMERLKNR